MMENTTLSMHMPHRKLAKGFDSLGALASLTEDKGGEAVTSNRIVPFGIREI